MSGADASFMFSIKALMKKKPYSVLIVSLVLSVTLFGFTLRIFERPLSTASTQNFNSIANSFWVTLITMTTVGYGDFYPKSNIGRLVGIIIAFWGVLFVSLFVVTLTNLLDFEGGEEKSYYLLQRLKQKDKLKVEAVNLLSSAYKKKLTLKKYPNNKRKQINALKDFRKYMIRFQKLSRMIRSNYDMDTEADRIKREIEDLKEEAEYISGNLSAICDHLGIDTADIDKDEQKNKDD